MAVTQIELPFGDSQLQVDVPSERLLGVVLPRAEQCNDSAEHALVRDALARPVGTPALRTLVRPGQQVAIVVSDMTRPCPTDRLLPPMLEELAAAGVSDADVTVVVALGLHRAQTAAELAALVGPAVYDRVRVVNHDPQDVVRLGVTSRGTPVGAFPALGGGRCADLFGQLGVPLLRRLFGGGQGGLARLCLSQRRSGQSRPDGSGLARRLGGLKAIRCGKI